MAAFVIRDLAPDDSIAELTALLHRAYKPLLDRGWRYIATSQSEDDTRKRIAGGRCLVAVSDGRVVGTAAYHYPNDWTGARWFRRDSVATVGQFAVEPHLQRRGIGSALMARVEEIAIGDGATELALSTAEPATHLIDYYAKRGFRIVEHTDATRTNGYRSVVMSKTL